METTQHETQKIKAKERRNRGREDRGNEQNSFSGLILIIGVLNYPKGKRWKELKEYSLKFHENYKPSDPIVQKQTEI